MTAHDSLNKDQFTGPEVWRGIKGQTHEEAASAAAANRRGEPGMEGGFYTTQDPVLASTYAQRFQGDKNGVLMRGKLHKDAKPSELGFIPAHHVKWESKNYTLGEAYRIDDQSKGYDYPPEHYDNL